MKVGPCAYIGQKVCVSVCVTERERWGQNQQILTPAYSKLAALTGSSNDNSVKQKAASTGSECPHSTRTFNSHERSSHWPHKTAAVSLHLPYSVRRVQHGGLGHLVGGHPDEERHEEGLHALLWNVMMRR